MGLMLISSTLRMLNDVENSSILGGSISFHFYPPIMVYHLGTFSPVEPPTCGMKALEKAHASGPVFPPSLGCSLCHWDG